MRTITLLLSFMLCSFYHAHAQGLIATYEETVTIQLPPNFSSHIDNPQIRAAVESRMRDMNRDQSRTAQLLVNNGVSIYSTGAFNQLENEKVTGREGSTNISGTIGMQFNNSGAHTYYKNHLEKLMLTQASVDGKEYLVNGPLNEYTWKIGRKKKTVSGYECIEATTKTASGAPVTAWYTSDIPVSDGPSSYYGLPGLILYLDVSNGMFVFSCTSIEQTDSLTAIEIPCEGEKISRTQYDKMMAERMQKMQDNNRVERGENSIRSSGSTVIRN